MPVGLSGALLSKFFDVILPQLMKAAEKAKTAQEWKKIFIETGLVFSKYARSEGNLTDELATVFSEESMKKLAEELRGVSGYEIKEKLYEKLQSLMKQYEVPYYEIESYTAGFTSVILQGMQRLLPEKYNDVILGELLKSINDSLTNLKHTILAMQNDLQLFQMTGIQIDTAEIIDNKLRKETRNPSIGIDFFTIDDDSFKESFSKQKDHECVYIRCRCREEGVYCIVNELQVLHDLRAVYVVHNAEGWEWLRKKGAKGNVLIPLFFADRISAIEGNTNIFCVSEDTPVMGRNVLSLRPRTLSTITAALRSAGMESDKAYELVSKTHGLYIPMMKSFYYGMENKKPDWLTKAGDILKKTCLLLGKWTDSAGDKLAVEEVSGKKYEDFINELLPFTRGEDPLICVIKHNNVQQYYLASIDYAWEAIQISTDEPIWNKYISVLMSVLKEPEKVFTYSAMEQLTAQLRGEQMFWSSLIRQGMLRSLIMRACYKRDEGFQIAADKLVYDILSGVKSESDWKYISLFFQDLCEASPSAVIRKLSQEINSSGSLLSLFEHQTENALFGKNEQAYIIFGLEQFLLQNEYKSDGLRLLLVLNKYGQGANQAVGALQKVLCPFYNFSAFQSADEKINAAKVALKCDEHTWELIHESLPDHRMNIVGELCAPKYREHAEKSQVYIADLQKTAVGYVELLLKHMDFHTDRWEKLLNSSTDFDHVHRKEVFKELEYEATQMTDEEISRIRLSLRKLIYHHRYFNTASWAMKEEDVLEYEELLFGLKTKHREYDYIHLFKYDLEYSLLHPVSYEEDPAEETNEKEAELLKEAGVQDVLKPGFDLLLLAESLADEPSSDLGICLAKYDRSQTFNPILFKALAKAQESGNMAIDYYSYYARDQKVAFGFVYDLVKSIDGSDDLLVGIYSAEARYNLSIPEINHADEKIKKLFWKGQIRFLCSDYDWMLSECKKYGDFNSYVELLYIVIDRKQISTESIFTYLRGIEEVERRSVSTTVAYELKKILGKVQGTYIDDPQRNRILAAIEFHNAQILDWEDMKCLAAEFKRSPEIFAELVSIIYRKDDDEINNSHDKVVDSKIISYLYKLYDMAQFCPAEKEGNVNPDELRTWVERLKKLLKKNCQSRLFTSLLGRLFSFGPSGEDGYEPCEAVRTMIEEYADQDMINEYAIAVYNRRGAFIVTAGRQEYGIAQEFKQKADYLTTDYPKTAQIFYSLYRSYMSDAKSERKRAEDGT